MEHTFLALIFMLAISRHFADSLDLQNRYAKWSDASIWGGKLPTRYDDITINAGNTST